MKNIFLFIILMSSVLARADKLLHCITDEVAGGSYKYYSLTHEGFIKIILSTEIGDADLYISEVTTRPTYEIDQYCLKSATCGEDSILIPDSFKRPVSIGVYGHSSHQNSKYILLVYETASAEDSNHDKEYETENEIPRPSIPMTVGWYLLDLLFQILF